MTSKPINSKNKGNSFEREISKKLSVWLTNGERDDVLWRTQSSGGRFTQRKAKGKTLENQSGDITSTHPASYLFSSTFHIECKAYKDINIFGLLNDSSKLNEWWIKAIEESKQSEKLPILIVKQNNKKVLFICNNELLDKITMFFNEPPRLSTWGGYGDCEAMHIFFLDDILQLDKKTFESMLTDTITIL